MAIDRLRGTGRTTRAMQEAPFKSIFVWCNGHLAYPKNLAKSLGRGDLQIVPPTNLYYKLCGSRTHVVVDHFARLPTEERRLIEEINLIAEVQEP